LSGAGVLFALLFPITIDPVKTMTASKSGQVILFITLLIMARFV
jgi:hypothetical protein